MTKKVIVFLAEGFEEVEAVTPIDYLRRAGIEVSSVAIGSSINVKSARNIQICADTTIDILMKAGELKANNWDGVVIPGGLPGADNLAASKEVGDFVLEMAKAGKLVSAICAAPARVLFPLGLLAGKNFTCFPGEETKVVNAAANSGANAKPIWKEDRVVVDGNIISSCSAGSAGEFSCAIVSWFLGEDEGKKLAERVLLLTNTACCTCK